MRNTRYETKKAFTLIELLVAVAILGMVITFTSVIFRFSIDAYRVSAANAEIMQKARAIATQLTTDFKGLRKDGEIFVVWTANRNPPYTRFDRMMFFADGDFSSYHTDNPEPIRGNIARISYMLANKPLEDSSKLLPAPFQEPEDRILARTQHILVSDKTGENKFDNFDPTGFNDGNDWLEWHNRYEYDEVTLDGWINEWVEKANMLTVITDVNVDFPDMKDNVRGAIIDTTNPGSIHMLLSEGVGEFKVQGWYDEDQRWVPVVDPHKDQSLKDSDFILNSARNDFHSYLIPGLLYPHGQVYLNKDKFDPNYYVNYADERYFNLIPGLGRALKFTFTIYDSKGVIKNGRTFSHIVYLDN